jgi:hypothetical protein
MRSLESRDFSANCHQLCYQIGYILPLWLEMIGYQAIRTGIVDAPMDIGSLVIKRFIDKPIGEIFNPTPLLPF